jgi:hypothetical protein
MDEKPEVKDLDNSFSFSSGSSDYVPAPVNKPLKAHVDSVKVTSQIDNFKTRPDGTPNPTYGQPKDIFIFNFKLDETDAKGQTYQAWVSTAVSDRSNLGKISEALLGSWSELIAKDDKGQSKYTVKDLIGLPLKVTLRPGKTNPDRLNIDVNKLFPPDEDQKRVEKDVVPDVMDLEDSGMAEAMEAFSK